MSDQDLRALQRKALASKDISDEIRYLAEWLRSSPTGESIAEAMGVVITAVMNCHDGARAEVTLENIDLALVVESGCSCGTHREGTTCSSLCDTWSFAVMRLKDGRFAYAQESSDTSGHG